MALKSIRHGDVRNGRHTKEYKAWTAMRYRCCQPAHPSYPQYGGRGITVCRRWQDSYVAFLEDMGRAPPDDSLGRIDVNGD
jgi:hypothetical protein